MKRMVIIIFLVWCVNLLSQTTSYLPKTLGNVWKFKTQAVDSVGNPTGPIIYQIDSAIAYTSFLGKQTLFTISGPEEGPLVDTSYYSEEGTNIFVHQNSFELDTLINFQLPNWLNVYRFNATLGTAYSIHYFDTTLTIPTLGTLPLRFLFRGTRLGTEIVIVPAGTFTNAMKFKLEFVVQNKITLPPPFPPIYIDLFKLPVNQWLAPNRFVIKTFQEPVFVDTLGLTIPGSISELEEFRPPTTSVEKEHKEIDFVLEQNFPNPFNPATSIQFRILNSAFITLKVYDILGNEVVTLINEKKLPGLYEVSFNANKYKLSSGVYFYQLKIGEKSVTKGMLYQK
ncbi:MAG: T9SS type A sorting domain-containing protein [Ignavibacteria bacterium]|nr:T9SS type A sorting domain-containing protein [Ignavibacteria bacterium]